MKTLQRSPKVQVSVFVAVMMARFLTVAIPKVLEHLLDVSNELQAPDRHSLNQATNLNLSEIIEWPGLPIGAIDF